METGTFGDKTPQRSDFVFDCPQALVGAVAGGRFARVQFVMPAVPGEGDVGHDDVGAGSQRFGLTVCRQSFHRGGGGDVDVRQQSRVSAVTFKAVFNVPPAAFFRGVSG